MEMIKPGTVGVYIIINNVNNKIYIGSSNDLRTRKNQHISSLNRNTHCNSYLQRAWNKYGKVNFTFKILELCTIEDQITIEQKYIDVYSKTHKLYNMAPVAGTVFGIKRTPETRKKMSERQIGIPHPGMQGRKLSPEHVEKIRAANTGYRHAESSKELNRQAHLGNIMSDSAKQKIAAFQRTQTRSEETKRRMSESKKGTIVSAETREKLRQANLGNVMSEANKEALRKANTGKSYTKGRIQTEEEKKRRSDSLKKHFEVKRKEKEIMSLISTFMIPSLELTGVTTICHQSQL